ncbi:elongation factor Ts [Patescibacteria group bacterium]|nr:elongation factor Ts [Patescibacteria group bacterium]
MEIQASDVKKLRDLTGAGMMDVKKALAEAKGDADKALAILKEKGAAIAASKSERATSQGLIATYIHPGDKIGAMVEVNCETDFVARGDDFKKLVKQIATHVAGMQPLYVAPEDVPADVIAAEKELYKSQVSGKAKDVASKAIEGKLEGFYESVCLLRQPFVLDQDKKVEDLINDVVGVVKENIKVARFARFEVGDR